MNEYKSLKRDCIAIFDKYIKIGQMEYAKRPKQPIDSIIPYGEDIFHVRYQVDQETAQLIGAFQVTAGVSATELTRRGVIVLDTTKDLEDFFAHDPETHAVMPIAVETEGAVFDAAHAVNIEVNIHADATICLEGLIREHPNDTVSSLLGRGIRQYVDFYGYASNGFEIGGREHATGELVSLTLFDAETD